MRESFWQKIEEAKMRGITTRQFEEIESLEAAIAYHQGKIDEYEQEIQNIEEVAKGSLEQAEI